MANRAFSWWQSTDLIDTGWSNDESASGIRRAQAWEDERPSRSEQIAAELVDELTTKRLPSDFALMAAAQRAASLTPRSPDTEVDHDAPTLPCAAFTVTDLLPDEVICGAVTLPVARPVIDTADTIPAPAAEGT